MKAREQQAAEALRDKTPLLKVGRASGHLNDRGHGFAPDKGTVMMLSWRDLTQGLIVYGRIGSGKSFSVLRPLARRYRESALAVGLRNELKGAPRAETVLDAKRSGGGALILDAKDGAIISDLGRTRLISSCAQACRWPYEGLEPDQITKALRGATGGKVDEKSKLWSDGGDAFLFHTGIILKAACQHEQAYRNFCIAKLEGLEHARLMMLLEREELEKRGMGLEDLKRRWRAWKSKWALTRLWRRLPGTGSTPHSTMQSCWRWSSRWCRPRVAGDCQRSRAGVGELVGVGAPGYV